MINLFKRKEGKLQKVFFSLIFFLVIFALTTIILTAQNETDSQNPISEDTISTEDPNSINETSPESTNEEESISESSGEENTLLEESANETSTSSQEIIQENSNNTFSEQISSNESSQTSSGIPENASPSNGDALETEIEKPELDVEIISDERITRGENMGLLVNITNIGKVEANNVVLELLLPNGFKSTEKENFGKILPGKFVTKEIEIQTDISSPLGVNEIKLLITYDEK